MGKEEASIGGHPCQDRGPASACCHDSPIDALGYAAATLTTVSFLPQAAKTLRTGDTAAISLRMYLLFTSGVALWALYGLLRGDGPLIVANAITLISAGLILQSKLRAVLAGRR